MSARSITSRYRRMALAQACAVAGLAACQGPPELEQASRAQLDNVREILTREGTQRNVRYLQIACPGGARDCAEPNQILLLEHRNDHEPFGATAQGSYVGCGPQAVANVEGYVFGFSSQVNQTLPYVDTYHLSDKRIGSPPDDVRRGLSIGLGGDWHQYRLKSGSRGNTWNPFGGKGPQLKDLKNHLKSGFPLMLLVNHGNHWQVVTGYRAPDQFFVIDYARRDNGGGLLEKVANYDPADGSVWRGEWKRFDDLGFYSFDAAPWFAFGWRGYNPQAYVAIEGFRRDAPQTNGGGAMLPGGGCDESFSCTAPKEVSMGCNCVCPESLRTTCNANPVNLFNESDCSCSANDGR